MAPGLGADEDDSGLGQRARERLALRQEAIARMDRLGARLFAGLDDLVDDQVGLRGRSGADMHRLVRHRHMNRVPVGIGIDGDRLDTHPASGLDDAARNLAAVRNQDFLEHLSRHSGEAGKVTSAVALKLVPVKAVVRLRKAGPMKDCSYAAPNRLCIQNHGRWYPRGGVAIAPFFLGPVKRIIGLPDQGEEARLVTIFNVEGQADADRDALPVAEARMRKRQ